jgi:hypothetical protein
MNPYQCFDAALNRLTSPNRFEPEGEPISVGGTNLKPINDEPAVHAMKRRYSGFGLEGKARVHCTCGFVGPVREQSDDFMSFKLMGDERNHREESRCIERSDLARECDQRAEFRGGTR